MHDPLQPCLSPPPSTHPLSLHSTKPSMPTGSAPILVCALHPSPSTLPQVPGAVVPSRRRQEAEPAAAAAYQAEEEQEEDSVAAAEAAGAAAGVAVSQAATGFLVGAGALLGCELGVPVRQAGGAVAASESVWS
mgnify:CR=1 FL=1